MPAVRAPTPEQRIRGVAWGMLVAGAVQLAVQVPGAAALRRAACGSRLRWRDRARAGGSCMLMGPAALGMGVHQINVVVDGDPGPVRRAWAPAALTYAERLIYLPLGIFGTALGTVLLPTFSRQAAQGRHGEHRATR